MAAIGIGIFRETGKVHPHGTAEDRQAFSEPFRQYPRELRGQYDDYGDGQGRARNRQGINQRSCGVGPDFRDAQNENRNSAVRIDKHIDQTIGVIP